tara:strand:+ start:31394 stop:33211 length:1818 start_codon:yes stop_codon:yes gene_type:complete
MKKVFFEEVIAQNFMSVGEVPLKLSFEPGVNIITGINKDKVDRRNGVGKSTVIDSIYFAIFGVTTRNMKKELIAHNLNNDTCKVALKFRVESPKGNDNFRIERTLRPSRISIYKNDELKTLDTIANTNKYICDVLSASQTTIRNCMIFSCNDSVPFMSKKTGEKRKFIEDILNLEVFSEMLTRVRADYNQQNKDFEIEMNRYEDNNNNITRLKISKENLIISAKDRKQAIKDRIKQLKIDISTQQDVIDNVDLVNIDDSVEILTDLKDKCSKLSYTIDKFKKKKWETAHSLKHNISHIDSLSSVGDVCPTCSAPYNEDSKDKTELSKKQYSESNKILKKDLITIESNLTKLQGAESKFKDTIEDIQDKISNANNINESIGRANSSVLMFNSNIEDLNNELSSLSTSTSAFDDNINQCEDNLVEIESSVHILRNKISLLENAKFILSDEGVKTFIIKKMLMVFNTTIQYYLKKMDSGIICFFNEFFEEELINENNKVCSYANFSGAERKSIDVACLFAFNDIRRLQSDVVYNIGFYDELFDSSFDAKGVGLVFDVLQERYEKFNECIYVVSHRRESAQITTGNVINLEKVNGATLRAADGELSDIS